MFRNHKNSKITPLNNDVVIQFNNKVLTLDKEKCSSYYVRFPEHNAYEESIDGIIKSMAITLYHGQIIKVSITGDKKATNWDIRCIPDSEQNDQIEYSGIFSTINYFISENYYSLQWFNLKVLNNLYNNKDHYTYSYYSNHTKQLDDFKSFGEINLGASIDSYKHIAYKPVFRESKSLRSIKLSSDDLFSYPNYSVPVLNNKNVINSVYVKVFGDQIYQIEVEYESNIQKGVIKEIGIPDIANYNGCLLESIQYEDKNIILEVKDKNILILADRSILLDINNRYTGGF